MNGNNGQKQSNLTSSAKECAYLAAFVALVIAAQAVLAVLPNVEVVSVLFIAYAFVFGVTRGLVAATAFSLLRQFLFGFYPTVLVLYLVHFNALCLIFGLLGKRVKRKARALVWVVLLAVVCTAGFTLFDNILTPLWYAYSKRATELYIKASIPFLISHVCSVGISVGLLFLPLAHVFERIFRRLNIKKS